MYTIKLGYSHNSGCLSSMTESLNRPPSLLMWNENEVLVIPTGFMWEAILVVKSFLFLFTMWPQHFAWLSTVLWAGSSGDPEAGCGVHHSLLKCLQWTVPQCSAESSWAGRAFRLHLPSSCPHITSEATAEPKRRCGSTGVSRSSSLSWWGRWGLTTWLSLVGPSGPLIGPWPGLQLYRGEGSGQWLCRSLPTALCTV